MSDEQLDQILRNAMPYDGREIDFLGAENALLEEIMSTSKPHGLRRRIATAVAVAAAATAAIGVPAIIDERSGDPVVAQPQQTPGQQQTPVVTDRIRFTSAALEVAKLNPRVLVTEPGWKVRYLEGFDPTTGGMMFQLGPDEWKDDEDGHINLAPSFDIHWYPADQYESYRQDRAHERGVQHLEVLGQRAQMISYSARDHAVMLPPEGEVFIELRGSVGDEDAFKRFLAESIEKVDVAAWLAAMPAEAVTAVNADERLEQVVADIPLPPGFEKTQLAEAVALDRYQFGAEVTGQVTCGWIAAWEQGDAAGKAAAVEALASSRDWKILREMDADGDYPDLIWQYADEIAAGKAPEGYRGGLGCR